MKNHRRFKLVLFCGALMLLCACAAERPTPTQSTAPDPTSTPIQSVAPPVEEAKYEARAETDPVPVLTEAGVEEKTAQEAAELLHVLFTQRAALLNGTTPEEDPRIPPEITERVTEQLVAVSGLDPQKGELVRVGYELRFCRWEEGERLLLLNVYETNAVEREDYDSKEGREHYLSLRVDENGTVTLEKERLQVFEYELDKLDLPPITTPTEMYRPYWYDTGLQDLEQMVAAAPEAARALAERFLEDLMTDSEGRTFRVTQYRNLKVELIPFKDISREELALYKPLEYELTDNNWLVKICVEFQYEGDMEPYGTGTGQWVDGLSLRDGVDFRLCLVNGDLGDYMLDSRWLW